MTKQVKDLCNNKLTEKVNENCRSKRWDVSKSHFNFTIFSHKYLFNHLYDKFNRKQIVSGKQLFCFCKSRLLLVFFLKNITPINYQCIVFLYTTLFMTQRMKNVGPIIELLQIDGIGNWDFSSNKTMYGQVFQQDQTLVLPLQGHVEVGQVRNN